MIMDLPVLGGVEREGFRLRDEKCSRRVFAFAVPSEGMMLMVLRWSQVGVADRQDPYRYRN